MYIEPIKLLVQEQSMSPTKHAIGAEKRELGVGDAASSLMNLGV